MEFNPVDFPGRDAPIDAVAPRTNLWTFGDLAKFVLFSLVATILCALGIVLAVTEAFEAADGYLGLGLGIDAGVEYATAALMAAYAVPSLCYVYYVIAVKYRLPFWDALGFTPFRKSMYWFLLLGALIAFAELLLARLLGMPEGNPFGYFASSPGPYWLFATDAVFIAPPVEEMVFRGFLYRPLERSLGAAGAIGVTAVGFGLIHWPQSWQIAFFMTLAGICLGVMRWKTGSLWPPILLHAGANFVFVVPFGLENFV